MSPRSLTDDPVETSSDAAPVRTPAPAATPARRLTVREMTIALQAAHGLLDGSAPLPSAPAAPNAAALVAPPTSGQIPDVDQDVDQDVDDLDAAAPAQIVFDDSATTTAQHVDEVGEGGADRSRAALCHDDALEGLPPVTPPIVASEPVPNDARPSAERQTATHDGDRPEPWLPAHDGPVSLTGVAAPRTRTVRRSTATLDKASRRPSKPRPASGNKAAVLDPALAAAAAAAPPRILIVSACGGSGATTAAVLLGAALAPAVATVLVAGGADRGALAVRADAHGGDVDQIAAWSATRPEQRRALPDGTATADAGTGRVNVAAAGRDEHGHLDPAAACNVFTTLAAHGWAGVLDWSSAALPPRQAFAAATHVLVTAPATSPGLLDAEYALEALQAALPASMPLSLLTVDVRGRNPRRAGRAALARLRALQLPITPLPYDPALADEPRVHWPALRPRTRTAVTSALSQLLPEHHRKDPK